MRCGGRLGWAHSPLLPREAAHVGWLVGNWGCLQPGLQLDRSGLTYRKKTVPLHFRGSCPCSSHPSHSNLGFRLCLGSAVSTHGARRAHASPSPPPSFSAKSSLGQSLQQPPNAMVPSFPWVEELGPWYRCCLSVAP